MLSICAWCGEPVAGPTRERAGTSHGICRPCLERRLAALAPAPVASVGQQIQRWLRPRSPQPA